MLDAACINPANRRRNVPWENAGALDGPRLPQDRRERRCAVSTTLTRKAYAELAPAFLTAAEIAGNARPTTTPSHDWAPVSRACAIGSKLPCKLTLALAIDVGIFNAVPIRVAFIPTPVALAVEKPPFRDRSRYAFNGQRPTLDHSTDTCRRPRNVIVGRVGARLGAIRTRRLPPSSRRHQDAKHHHRQNPVHHSLPLSSAEVSGRLTLPGTVRDGRNVRPFRDLEPATVEHAGAVLASVTERASVTRQPARPRPA